MNPADETTRQPHRRTGDLLVAAFVWSVVIATAALEVLLLDNAISSTGMHGFTRFSYITSSAGMVFFWVYSLIWEHIDRHNRRKARSARRLAWLTQGLVLVVEVAGAWQERNIWTAIGALYLLVNAQLAWKSWMSTLALHPDDQKIVDQAIAEEERALAEQLKAEAEQHRADKLEEALSKVRRFTLPTTPVPRESEATAQEYSWELPKGQHSPVVYFIRNGDRVKIGTTTDIRARIRRLALRPENVALLLEGGRDRERALHRQFAAQRVGTSEWFRHAGSLAQFITDENAKISQEGRR